MLFKSVTQVMQAEKILKNAGLQFKIIPVPKTISTECGVCIRFEEEHLDRIKDSLAGRVEFSEIRKL